MESSKENEMKIRATTVLAVKKDGKTVIGGDGQVTLGDTVMKNSAKKVRKLYHDKVVAGFAGGVADAFTLFDRFEEKLNNYGGDTARAAIELVKDWRSDKMLRRLEAMLIVGSKDSLFLLSGSGEIIQPDDDIVAVGSGGSYALAAARALMQYSKLSAKEIVKNALQIAASICIYTNHEIAIEEL